MPGHAAGHGMNTVLNRDAALLQRVAKFAHHVLGLRRRHPVTGNEHHLIAYASWTATSSRPTSRISPCWPSTPATVAALPKAPNSTFVIERFIARHIRIERMNPEKPSKVPAMISTLFESTKPVAAEARPAYEFSRDITTGMSADPIGNTSRMPNTNANVSMR